MADDGRIICVWLVGGGGHGTVGLSSITKGRGIPITGHGGPRGMWMQGSTYSQPRHYEEVGWLVLRSAAFTPGEIHRYSFYRRLSGPQDQSGHEGVKKNLHPSDTRDRTRAVQARSETPCRLRHLAHRPSLSQSIF